MEKTDLAYFVMAVGVVIVAALVVKPLVTGEPVILWAAEDVPVPTVTDGRNVPVAPPYLITATPTPTWSGTAETLEFVDPATYHLTPEQTSPTISSPPNEPPPDTTTVTYAVISGQRSGTTEIVHIPFPYWYLDYSDITPMNYIFPSFNVQVMDANDPNRFVRIISLNYMDFRSYEYAPEQCKQQWISKFCEGYRDYYFVINTKCIDSYTLRIKVPQRYV